MKKISIHRIAHCTGHNAAIYALCMALKGEHFFTGGADGYIVEWEHTRQNDGKLLAQVPSPVYCLATHPQQLWLMAGTASGNIHVIDLASRKEIRNIEAHSNGVYHISYLQKHPYILTAGGDGNLRVWDRNSLQLLHSFNGTHKNARVIAVSANETEIAVGFSDHYIRTWSLPGFEPLQEWEAHGSSVFGLSYAPDGLLLSGGRDVMLKIWNLQPGPVLLENITAHLLHLNYIAFNPSATLFATVSMDKTLKIWDGQTRELLKVIDHARHQGHLSSVNKVAWVNDTHLITCSDDRSAMVWEIVPGVST